MDTLTQLVDVAMVQAAKLIHQESSTAVILLSLILCRLSAMVVNGVTVTFFIA